MREQNSGNENLSLTVSALQTLRVHQIPVTVKTSSWIESMLQELKLKLYDVLETIIQTLHLIISRKSITDGAL